MSSGLSSKRYSNVSTSSASSASSLSSSFKTLTEDFERAVSFLNSFNITDTSFYQSFGLQSRVQLYGLYSLVRKGPCVSERPNSDRVAQLKWDAHKAVSHLSKEQAMSDYIDLITKLAPKWREKIASQSVSSPSSDIFSTTPTATTLPVSGGGAVIKQLALADETELSGNLFKKSNYLKQWNRRHVVLSQKYIYYYTSKSSDYPRGFIYLASDCHVEKEPIDTSEQLYPFVITHPVSNQQLTFATQSESETNKWVSAIQKAIALSEDDSDAPEQLTSTSTSQQLSQSQPTELNEQVQQSMMASQEQLRNRKADWVMVDKMNWQTAVNETLDAVLTLANHSNVIWNHKQQFASYTLYLSSLFNSPVNESLFMAEKEFNFSARSVWDVMWNKRTAFDHQLATIDLIEQLGPQAKVEYLTYKPIWPTLPRDLVRLSYWRVLDDKTIAMVTRSVTHPLCPEKPGEKVRMILHAAGILIVPHPSDPHKCTVTYVFHGDVKVANLPKLLVRTITMGYIMILNNVEEILKDMHPSETAIVKELENIAIVKSDKEESESYKRTLVRSSSAAARPSIKIKPLPSETHSTNDFVNKVRNILTLLMIPLISIEVGIVVYSVSNRRIELLSTIVFLSFLAVISLILIEVGLPTATMFVPINWKHNLGNRESVHATLTIDMSDSITFLLRKYPADVSYKHLVIKALALCIASHPVLQVKYQFFALRPVSVLDLLLLLSSTSIEEGYSKYICVRDPHIIPIETLSQTIFRAFETNRQDVPGAIIFSDTLSDPIQLSRGLSRFRSIPMIFSVGALRRTNTKKRILLSISVSVDPYYVDLLGGVAGLSQFLDSIKNVLEVQYRNLLSADSEQNEER